jgi:hypothetical protein
VTTLEEQKTTTTTCGVHTNACIVKEILRRGRIDTTRLRLLVQKTRYSGRGPGKRCGGFVIRVSFLVRATSLGGAQVTTGTHQANVGKHPTLDGDDPGRGLTWVWVPEEVARVLTRDDSQFVLPSYRICAPGREINYDARPARVRAMAL